MRHPLPFALIAALFLASPAALADGWEVTAAGALVYDDNLFLLDEDQQADLDSGGSSNNDKLDDMESSSDLIVALGARVDWSTKAISGRTTRFRLEPGVDVYLQNSKCTHASLRAGIDQRVWKGGDVYFRTGFTPSRFKKNYFVEGTDSDAPPDGVSGSEKDYEPGLVTSIDGLLGVRSDVGKIVTLHLEAGGGAVTWASPLANRDQRLLVVEAGGDVRLGKRVRVGAAYEFVDATSPDDDEVVITDRERQVTAVDRSFSSGKIAGAVDVELTKFLDLRGGASWRQRNWTSTGADDPYADRVDQRIAFGVGLELDLGDFDVGIAVEHASNGTQRPNDPDRSGDRELDYAKNVFSLSAAYRF